MLTVGEVAGRSGVTVRTLHHYDRTGLLSPSARSDAGYRLYDDHDIGRLQRILTYRELGFPLDRIAELLDDPDADVLAHLTQQHRLLTHRIDRLQHMLAAVELTMEATTMGIQLTPEELLEVFGADHANNHEAYQDEAEQRWGDTDAWAQSRRRAAAYGKDDWTRIKAEGDAAVATMAAALRAGLPPDSDDAMAGAEAHRRHIHDNFYECSYAMQRNLADMYVADERFTKTYDDIEPGLAAYVRDAIHANADARDA